MERINDRLLNWASILDPVTRAQACETASMPFIHPHMALMPDAHLGKGATVGSVIPTKGAIMPAAVSVDIGCGMDAVLTPYTSTDIDERVHEDEHPLRWLHTRISSVVPLSAGGRNQTLTPSVRRRVAELESLPGVEQAEACGVDWRAQLGSLGSGNHFIELSYDEDDRVWAFLHSGSRGVGNRLASAHIKIAQDQCAHDGVKLPNRDLAYLTEGTPGFDRYMEALLWCQVWARMNRAEMMDRVLRCLGRWIGLVGDVQRLEQISCHHNYTASETWGGEQVWISRKGAINASQGVAGLIPGSMGTRSYIVAGKGDQDALGSAPHGAGRNHSRSAAKKLFDRADLDAKMAGIVWGESDAFLDEHPAAYKPIDVVMKDAADLVEIRHELRQFLNVKGQ